jgi:signal transduction histidine kinase
MLPNTKTRVLFGSGFTLLLLSGIAAMVAVERSLAAQQWVIHTHEVQVALLRLESSVSRAGRTRVQYVNSGDPGDLAKYELALAQIPTATESFKELIRDNSGQQDRLAELESLIQKRRALIQQSVDLRRSGESTLEKQSLLTQNIATVAGGMDALIQRMQDGEQSLLATRIETLRKGSLAAAILLSSTFFFASLFLILHYRFLNSELTARQEAEASLRKLSAHILRIQDEERRKFSRELHDSLGQYLAAMMMNLELLDQDSPHNSLVADCIQLVQQAIAETRTISHLLHPPLLDQAGFDSAAKWYVEGFSKRSGIETSLDLPQHFERLPAVIELGMFRILQEALTNIHRHANASRAAITVALSADNVSLAIRDNGKGIPRDVLERFRKDGFQSGVGLAGMRERLRELGGYLEIQSDGASTLLLAIFPRSQGALLRSSAVNATSYDEPQTVL